MTEADTLEPVPTSPQEAVFGSWTGIRVARTQTGTLMLEVGIPRGGFTHIATMAAHKVASTPV